MGLPLRACRTLARALLSDAERARLARATIHDAGHGYDRLGLNADAVAASIAATRFLYEVWFRVDSRGSAQVPSDGPVILAANHSGLLPLDGVMLWAAGDETTIERLLETGEAIGVFPEGVPGIAKPRRERYRLKPFRVGHAELAIRHRAPIVPIGIVGAEEQWPELARLRSFHAFGAPYLPVPATPLPLPVRYRIRYGAPIDVHRHAPEAADDPEIVRALALEVQRAVQSLVDGALAERKGWFR